MRLPLATAALLLLLAACSPAPPPAPAARTIPDPSSESWYAPAVTQLAAAGRDARRLLEHGRSAEAARVVTDAQPLANRLLGVPRPTLDAMEAVSDLDEVYGQMLMRDGRYGWARMVFQKEFTRWKSWKPATGETLRRLKAAESAMAACDRHLSG